MTRRFLSLIIAIPLIAGRAADALAQSSSPSTQIVSSVSSWPEGGILKHGDKVQVTTFDMSGVPFPCKVKNVTADQLVCGKSHETHLRAFDRSAVQSIVLEGHARHKVSLFAYVGSASLVISGLACVLAGAPEPGVYLLWAGISGFVAAGIADRVEAYRGPTDAKAIYVAAPPVPVAPVTQPM